MRRPTSSRNALDHLARRSVPVLLGIFSAVLLAAIISNRSLRPYRFVRPMPLVSSAGTPPSVSSSSPFRSTQTILEGANTAKTAPVRLLKEYGTVPMGFEETRGEMGRRIQFAARGAGYSLFLAPQEAILALMGPGSHARTGRGIQNGHSAKSSAGTSLTPSILRMKFVGASLESRLLGAEPLPTKVNY